MIKLFLNKSYDKEELFEIIENNNKPLIPEEWLLTTTIILLTIYVILAIVGVKYELFFLMPFAIGGAGIMSFALTIHFFGLNGDPIELSKSEVNYLIKEINDNGYDKIFITDGSEQEVYIDNFLYIDTSMIKENNNT